MLADKLRLWAHRTRHVAVSNALVVAVTTPDEDAFRVGLERPRPGTPPGTLPRERKPAKIFTRKSNLSAGDRLAVDERGLGTSVWEITSPPRELHAGPRLEGYELDAHLVAELYPQLATIEELGGSDVAANVPVAIAPAGEDSAGHGRRQDFRAEIPIEFAGVLDQTGANRQLRVGADLVLKVATAERVLEPAVYVRLTLRGRG